MERRTAGSSGVFVVAAGIVLMISTAHAAPSSTSSEAPLIGDWGGSQVQLQLTETGGKLELSCASASIDTPVRLDATSKFGATGRYESFTGGPTQGDVAPAMAKVHFDGHVDGDTMHLSIRRGGDEAAERYTLERGRRVKLIRCS